MNAVDTCLCVRVRVLLRCSHSISIPFLVNFRIMLIGLHDLCINLAR